MNLLHHTYVIHLIWTFTTFKTLWEDNNPFKNLFALYIKQIKTYSHPCKEIQDSIEIWIPGTRFQLLPWNLDSGLLGLYSGFQSPGFQIPQAEFSRIPEFPDSLTLGCKIQGSTPAFYLKSNKKGVQDIAWSPSDWYKPMCRAAKITVTRKHEVFFSLWRPQKTANWGFKVWVQAP